MEPEKKSDHTRRPLAPIKEKYDNYSIKSREHLRLLIFHSMKKIYVGALCAIESRMGKEFPQYKEVRSDILRIGNEAIREMHKYLNKFNIEMIPEIVEFLLEGKRQGVEKENE